MTSDDIEEQGQICEYHKGLCRVESGAQGMDRLAQKPDEWGPGSVDTAGGGEPGWDDWRCCCPQAPQL